MSTPLDVAACFWTAGPLIDARSAPANSSPVWKRSSGFFDHRAVEERDQRRRHVRVHRQDVDRVLVGDLEHELRHGLALNGSWPESIWYRLTASENRSSGPRSSCRELLGRHVGRRAEHHAGLGLRAVGETGDAEVGELQRVGVEVIHHVRRLDVSVHDALAVRVAERLGGAGDDAHRLVDRQQVAGLAVGHEVAAFQQLHRDVAQVVLLAGVVDGDDVRVRQAPGGLGLAEETLLHFGELVRLELLGERHRLDRHHAADLRVLAEVHHAHRALAELLLDLVAAEHRLLDGAALARGPEDAGVGLAAARAAEHHRLGELLRARQAGREILELRVEVVHVLEHGLRLVELALPLEVERKVVQVVEQRVGQRHLAELVPGEVELPCPW
jgi:hypothetical protein